MHMRKATRVSFLWNVSLLVAAIAGSGCASHPEPKRHRVVSDEPAQIQLRLAEIFDAAQKKEMDRLDSYHLYGRGFTKFGPGQSGRLDSTAAREGEHHGLGSVSRLSMRAEDLKIDIFRDVGIATFILNSSFLAGTNEIARRERSTLVFVKDRGEWKIVHEHFSAFNPQP